LHDRSATLVGFTAALPRVASHAPATQRRAGVWGCRSCKRVLCLHDRSATLVGFTAALPRVASHAPAK